MGANKALLKVDGVPLIDRVLTAVSGAGDSVTVCGADTELARYLAGREGVESLPDSEPGAGPFSALVDILGTYRGTHVLAVSCDLPWLNKAAGITLLDVATATGADVAVPLVHGRRQWHAVVLRTAIAQDLGARRSAGVRSLWRGLAGLSQVTVTTADEAAFLDIDTPDELRLAQHRSGGCENGPDHSRRAYDR